MEAKILTPAEKREWALSVARRMMQNKRDEQARTLAYYKEHPEELAEIKEQLRRLEKEKLVDKK